MPAKPASAAAATRSGNGVRQRQAEVAEDEIGATEASGVMPAPGRPRGRRGPAGSGCGSSVGVAVGEPHRREAAEQLLEGDPHLEARERCAGAEVDAVTEGQHRPRSERSSLAKRSGSKRSGSAKAARPGCPMPTSAARRSLPARRRRRWSVSLVAIRKMPRTGGSKRSTSSTNGTIRSGPGAGAAAAPVGRPAGGRRW